MGGFFDYGKKINASSLFHLFDNVESVSQGAATALGRYHVFAKKMAGRTTPNEDSCAVFASGSALVLAVADGVGGGPAGDQASKTALLELQNALASSEDLRVAILDAFEKANAGVMALGLGAATTLSIVSIEQEGGQRWLRSYHVGDSRALVVGGRGKLKFSSIDHSPVGYAVQAGLLSEDEAIFDEQRHMVSNWVGSPTMRIDVGTMIRLSPRDTVVIGSDGLFDNLRESEVMELARKGSLAQVAEKLASLAAARMELAGEAAAEVAEPIPSKPDDISFCVYRS